MSDYQRFVSYIYEYHGSEKLKNCGFSRVEVRNHQCRLEIHMKLPAYPFTPSFRVYAFVPKQGKLTGIFLGNAVYQQGTAYGIFTIPDRKINDQPYDMKDLGGLFIQTDSGQSFATAWKDISISPDLFIRPEETPQVTAASVSALPPEEPGMLEDTLSDSDSSQPEDTFRPVNSTQPPEATENAKNAGRTGNIGKTGNTGNTGNTGKTGKTGKTEAAQETETAEKAQQPPSPSADWENILRTYPQAQPFFDDSIHQCVRLSLKDIPTLWKLGIPIGSNQFLTHACQCYQHFLLGKFVDSREGEYLLAVPGVYDEKEQFLASMFGFPNFRPARNAGNPSVRPGQFGYWYRLLY